MCYKRDSLAQRQRTGRPGSKRHQRYLNAEYLNAADSLTNFEGDNNNNDHQQQQQLNGDEQQQLVWANEWRSLFEELFHPENEEALRSFRFGVVPEEERPIDDEEFFAVLARRFGMEDEVAAQQFAGIKVETRRLLKEAFNLQLIQTLERKLLQYMLEEDEAEEDHDCFTSLSSREVASMSGGRTRGKDSASSSKQLNLLFKNSRDRRVCHGVCSYYSLASWSEDTSCGLRVTVVSKSKGNSSGFVLPDTLLSEYLLQLHGGQH